MTAFISSLMQGGPGNNVRVQYQGGYIINSGSVAYTIPLINTNAFRVRAQYSHHSVASYGCAIDAIYGFYSGHAGLQSTNTILNVSSSGGGSFTVTRSGTGPVYVTKTAGSYAGGGWYSIEVISGGS